MRPSAILLFCFSILPVDVSARSQNLWITPNGTDPGTAEVIYNGEYYPLEWAGWSFQWLQSHMGGVQVNSLWIATSDSAKAQTPYFQLVKEGVNISRPGSYIWKVDIPESRLTESPTYSFIFVNSSTHPHPLNKSDSSIESSPVIILKDRLQPTPSSSGAFASDSSLPNHPMAPGPPRAAFAPSTGAYVGISLCSLGIALCFAGLLVYKILGRRKERQLAKERNERWNGKPSDAANGAGSTGTVSIDRQVNSGKEERKSITLVGRNESTMSGENESDDVDAISRVV